LKNQEWQYGLHAVQAMLKTAPERIFEIKIQRNRDDERVSKIKQQAEKYGIPVSWAQRKELDKIAEEGRHQGVVALCKAGELRDEKFLKNLVQNLTAPAFLLILDGVTDPHNLGAVLRSADAAGVHAVIAPKDRSVGITPVVAKVACGAAETMPFVVVTNLARTMKELQESGVWIVGTAGEAETLVYESDLKGPLAIVMGAEEKGMRRLTRENCDNLVKLPMAGSVSSLNVSVATGVCLFEALRQRR